jgi:hypothetical protein
MHPNATAMSAKVRSEKTCAIAFQRERPGRFSDQETTSRERVSHLPISPQFLPVSPYAALWYPKGCYYRPFTADNPPEAPRRVVPRSRGSWAGAF